MIDHSPVPPPDFGAALFEYALKYEDEAIKLEAKAVDSPIADLLRDQASRNRHWAAQNLDLAVEAEEMHTRLAPWRAAPVSAEWFDLAVEDERSAVRAQIMVDYTSGEDRAIWARHAKAQRANSLLNLDRALRQIGLLPPLAPPPRSRRWFEVDDDLFVDA